LCLQGIEIAFHRADEAPRYVDARVPAVVAQRLIMF